MTKVKQFTVTFLPSGKKIVVEEGGTIFKAAEEAGVHLNSICGGEGTCGKCRVIIKSGEVRGGASSLLSEEDAAKGYVLSCQATIHSDITVEVPPESSALQTAEGREETSGRFRSLGDWDFNKTGFALDPLVKKIHLKLATPTLEDNLDDLARLLRGVRRETGLDALTAPLPILKELPTLLRDSGWDLTATTANRGGSAEVIRIQAGDTTGQNYGLALDIGTTTVVAHLIDLKDGRTLNAAAAYNSQIVFGEDVIKRIIRSEEDGTEPLSRAVRRDINKLIRTLSHQAKLKPDEITALICAGNTTMIALFLGITPRNIRREPYITPLASPPSLRACDLDIHINKDGIIYSVPGIAGWVGGDITAGVLASGMDRSPALSLFIDIGTNGEIVVGNREWRLACSCSAGPAFEGSGVTCGSRAVAGAIDRIDLKDTETVEYQTINGRPPVGICGSGLLDAVSEFFRVGVMGRDGRFDPGSRSSRLGEHEGEPAFVIARGGESADGSEIVITQADIDNLVRAKAAIYAGISVLLKAVNLDMGRIERIYVSGGFGNYINIKRAICIGLLPDIVPEKISFIGNGAVRGAKTILLSRPAREQAQRIASSTTYFELSTDNNFMDEYTRAMFLPHTDIEDFPSCPAREDGK